MKVLTLDKDGKFVPYESVYGTPLHEDDNTMFRMVARNHDDGFLISTIKRQYPNDESKWLYETAVFIEGKWNTLFSWDSIDRDDALEVHKGAVKRVREGQYKKS